MASLVYHAGALGDFITVLPAIACWSKAHPGEKLILLGKPAYASVSSPAFDETWDAEARTFAGLFSAPAGVDRALAQRLQGIASALVYARSESPLPGILAAAGVKEIVRQDPFPPTVTPVVDYHLSLFAGPLEEEDRMPRVFVPVIEMKGPAPVVLNPGSGSRKKNWPLERYLHLARWFTDQGENVAWVVGPAEEGTPIPSGSTVWRSLPLRELAARVALCRLFVGNDSGVTHLSAAAGCATVALFGVSDYRVWAPRGRRVSVIVSGSNGMKGITVEDAMRVCQDFLEMK